MQFTNEVLKVGSMLGVDINAAVKHAKTGGIASDGYAPHTGTWPCNEKLIYSYLAHINIQKSLLRKA